MSSVTSMASARPPSVRAPKSTSVPLGLQLPGGDRIQHQSHLALEHAPRHRIERDFGFVARLDTLQ
jgi:hypothetical protein